MTAPVPPWRIVARSGAVTTIAYTDDDFTEVQVMVMSSVVGTAELDGIIRRSRALRRARREIVAEPGA